jgi:glycosyltransferase involved in cell wall biosynthesis
LNVLYIAHYYPPFAVGGVEDHTRSLARAMRDAGHAVRVFHGVVDQGFDDYRVLEHEVDGIPCTAISVDLRTIEDFSGSWKQAEVDRIFDRYVGEHRFDLAHAMHLTRLSTGIVDVLRRRRIPRVLTLHDYWMQCARGQRVRPDGGTCFEIDETRCAECVGGWIDHFDSRKPAWRRALLGISGNKGERRHLEKIVERRTDMQRAIEGFDLLLTASGFTRDTFREWGIRKEIVVERQGVDPELADGYREAPAPRLRFGFLGRIMETKGLEILIDAFDRLDVEADLVIHGLGDPAYVEGLKRRSKHPRIRFAGPFEQKDLAKVYAAFDVQVVPSTWLECSPLVLQTASLFRKPAIVASIGGLVEMVRDGVDGLQFAAGDAGDLAAKMRSLVADRSIVARLAAAIVPARSTAAYAEAIARHYEALIDRYSSTSGSRTRGQS